MPLMRAKSLTLENGRKVISAWARAAPICLMRCRSSSVALFTSIWPGAHWPVATAVAAGAAVGTSVGTTTTTAVAATGTSVGTTTTTTTVAATGTSVGTTTITAVAAGCAVAGTTTTVAAGAGGITATATEPAALAYVKPTGHVAIMLCSASHSLWVADRPQAYLMRIQS